jgi:hypothetical protein
MDDAVTLEHDRLAAVVGIGVSLLGTVGVTCSTPIDPSARRRLVWGRSRRARIVCRRRFVSTGDEFVIAIDQPRTEAWPSLR